MEAMKLHLTMHKDQRYLVVGLGLTGYSVASYLLQHNYKCTVHDDREQPPYLAKLLQNYPSVKVLTEDLTESLLADIDCLIVSPGLSVRSTLMLSIAKSGKRIIGDIELFAEAVDKPVLAITGSNGKSTVTSLLGEMIEADGKTGSKPHEPQSLWFYKFLVFDNPSIPGPSNKNNNLRGTY